MPLTTTERAETYHHGIPVHEVVLLAETDADRGLSGVEAARRLVELGPNTLPERRAVPT
jgi:cation-transporting ATPase F